MSSLDYLDLCRLCLVKDRVSVPIFEGEGDVRQIFLKIAACLPVKVAREDKLPKKICDDCVYKVELFYQFWNTTANAEKQLLQWLGEVDIEDNVSGVLSTDVMKQEQSGENRLDGTVMQQVSSHQNNMGIGIMDNMGLGMPIIMSSNNQQQITSVPMDTSGSSVQLVQAVPGPSSQTSQDQANTSRHQDEEEDESEEEDNSDDECDGDQGLPVKEESEDDPGTSGRTLEPTTFVNVSVPCDEAGPSGLQQQKIVEMPEIAIPQTTDGDPKSGYFVSKIAILTHPEQQQQCGTTEMKHVFAAQRTDLLITSQPLQTTAAQTNDRLFQCSLCGEGFINEQILELHFKKHEQPQEEEGSKSPYGCEECGREMTESAEDDEAQAEEKAHVCGTCGYASNHRQNLASHQRRHNNDYRYQCETCGSGFYSRSSYQEHQLMHSREKPFQCEICNATFRYRQGLRLHAKLHQPDYIAPQKKHHCELCNKRFSRKQVLLVHMRTHGNVGMQNEYVCHICGKSVSSKTYLTVHVRKHTGEKPHVCNLCGKGFISQNYLSVHRRTHTGERPHKCTHCEKRFTQRTTLVVHLRGHTGDRPYPCSCCHKSFASKTMLNSHLKTHAKQNARQQQEQQQEQQQSLESVTVLLPE